MKIDELHDRIFEALTIVDNICKEEKVSYFIEFGTAIGAVREKDFIPWDDDADLIVKIEDYDAFKAAMEKKLPSYMHMIEAPAFAPHFYDFVARVYDERYMVREANAEDDFYYNLQNYVGTDVFVSSRLPDSELGIKLHFFIAKILYGLAMGHRKELKKEKYSNLQWLQIKTLALIGKMINIKTIWKWWDGHRRKRTSENTKYRVCLDGSIPEWKKIPADIFEGEAAKGMIRGKEFPLVPGYDRHLRLYYGDYMTPPKNFDAYVQHTDEEEKKILRERWEARIREEEK